MHIKYRCTNYCTLNIPVENTRRGTMITLPLSLSGAFSFSVSITISFSVSVSVSISVFLSSWVIVPLLTGVHKTRPWRSRTRKVGKGNYREKIIIIKSKVMVPKKQRRPKKVNIPQKCFTRLKKIILYIE